MSISFKDDRFSSGGLGETAKPGYTHNIELVGWLDTVVER